MPRLDPPTVEHPHPSAPVPMLPGRYRPLGQRRSGGMGTVLLVHDTVLDREVALKLSVVGRESAVYLEAFRVEVAATARLQHPVIVPVYEVGALDDGRIWYTMPWIAGKTLARHTPAELPRLVRGLVAVCDALHYAHGLGLIHRDVKPSNILVDGNSVRLVDWGISRWFSTPDRPSPGALHSGSPGFCAPEQRTGGEQGPAVDVWGLGATLRATLPDDPPAELARLAAQAMADDPAARGTVQALGRALEAWSDGALRRERAAALLNLVREQARVAKQLGRITAALPGAILPAAVSDDSRRTLSYKRQMWRMEDLTRAAETQRQLSEATTERRLLDVLHLDPYATEAHERLTHHYLDQLRHAEREAPRRGVDRVLTFLKAHNPRAHDRWLATGAQLTLATEPAVPVRVYEGVERDRQRIRGPLVYEGLTPLDGVALPPGALILQLGQYVFPIVLRRGEHFIHAHPETGPRTLRLPAPIPGACFIPEGWFLAGDPDAPDGTSIRRIWLHSFFIQEHSVTIGAWNRYRAEALGEPAPLPGDPDLPVDSISALQGDAYARWWSGVTGRAWRLPHELEWEKAARGADGRRYPWGDTWDDSFANCATSTPGAPQRTLAGSFPTDRSVYGVWDCAGNVRNICNNGYLRQGWGVDGAAFQPEPGDASLRSGRGGVFIGSGVFAYAGARFARAEATGAVAVGLRLVCQA